MTSGEVVKIDYEKFRFNRVAVPVIQPGIVNDFCKVIKLKIVHKHGKSFLNMLRDHMVYYKV